MTPVHSWSAFWRFLKRVLHLASPVVADEAPIPFVPDTIKEQAMSFSIQLFGHVASEIEAEASKIEAELVEELKALLAKFPSITGGLFSGATVSTDLGAGTTAPPAPAGAVTDSGAEAAPTPPDAAVENIVPAPVMVAATASVAPPVDTAPPAEPPVVLDATATATAAADAPAAPPATPPA